MGPKRDRITPREDRLEQPGPDDLHPDAEDEAVQSLPPSDEGEGIEGSPTSDPAEEAPLRPE